MRNDLSTEKETDVTTPIKRNPFASLSHILNKHRGVACLCLAIAITAMMGLVACEWTEAETETETKTETGTETETKAETDTGSAGTPLDTTETEPLPPENYRFSFRYDPFGGFAIPGDLLTITTWVINEGDPFTFEGSSKGYAPTAALVHKENGYRIQGNYDTTLDLVRFTVNTGDKGQASQVFAVPVDAPTGDYDLYLSFDGQEQIFENVLTVAIP